MYLDALGKEIDFLNFDLQRQQIPYIYYKIFQIVPTTQAQRITWTIPLDKGYGFLLRRLGGIYGLINSEVPNSRYPPLVKIELFDTTRGRTWQNESYPLRLVLTPGDQGYWAIQPNNVDLNNFGIMFKAEPVKNKITYNNYYAYRQTIKVEMNVEPFPVVTSGLYIELLLDGYLIPELGLEQWQ